MSILDKIEAASGVSKTVSLILDGKVQAEWDAALAQADAVLAREGDDGSLAMPDATAAFKAMDALRERVQASEVTFVFTSENLEWTEYLTLQSDHPPREGNLLDRVRGFNVETFYPVLIRLTGLTAFTADSPPEPMTDAAWDRLLGKPADGDTPAVKGTLNVRQVNDLADAAYYVMNGESRVPPSARSLLKSQDFGASLAQPSPGESVLDGSEDGNPPTSPESDAPTPPPLTTWPT